MRRTAAPALRAEWRAAAACADEALRVWCRERTAEAYAAYRAAADQEDAALQALIDEPRAA